MTQDCGIIAAAIIDGKTAVDQLPGKLRGQFFVGEVDNSRDASVEQGTRFANIKCVADPEKIFVDFEHG